MKIGKAIKWSVLVILLVIIIAVTLVILRIDAIVKTQVETQSTASTKLQTSLDSARLSLLGGTIGLNELKIAPPAGFSSPTMFEMGALKVGVSYGELMKNPLKIDEIIVDKPKLVVEQAGGKLNVYSAMQQMPKSDSSSTMRMVIGKLQVNDTQVVIKPGIPMLQSEYSVTLPSITVLNVGTADNSQNGAAVKDVLQTVLTAMMDKLKESDKVPAEMRPFLTSNQADLKSAATQKATEYLQQNKDAQKIQEGLKGIFGGKK